MPKKMTAKFEKNAEKSSKWICDKIPRNVAEVLTVGIIKEIPEEIDELITA